MNDRSSIAQSAQMLSRRDVLIGAAATAGAMVLGIDGSAHADASSSGAPVSVAYWNGVSFVDPLTQTPQGYLAQTGATVWLGHHSVPKGAAGPSLLTLDVHFKAIGPDGDFDAPFLAWTSRRTARFRVPISPLAGLALSIQVGGASAVGYFLSTNLGSGYPMLRTGTYVIAAGTPWWPGLSINNGVVVDRGTGQRSATESLMLKIS